MWKVKYRALDAFVDARDRQTDRQIDKKPEAEIDRRDRRGLRIPASPLWAVKRVFEFSCVFCSPVRLNGVQFTCRRHDATDGVNRIPKPTYSMSTIPYARINMPCRLRHRPRAEKQWLNMSSGRELRCIITGWCIFRWSQLETSAPFTALSLNVLTAPHPPVSRH